jgi:hypothetical protein
LTILKPRRFLKAAMPPTLILRSNARFLNSRLHEESGAKLKF